MQLPKRIFLTGVPGSHWSGIAQDIEQLPGINTSDHNDTRIYEPGHYAGHKGAYFGQGMEFDSLLITSHLDAAWSTHEGTKIIKSHEWAEKLHIIKEVYPNDWIMLVYRPDMASYAWWHEAGGFNIKYPSYKHYRNSAGILAGIIKQNAAMLHFSYSQDATWHHYSTKWVKDTFGTNVPTRYHSDDILVTVIK